MLALLAKAVEVYTAAHGGTTQPFLRVLVPINVRDEAEKGDYGNRISVLPVDLPFNVDDPLEHLKAVMKFSKVMKESSLAYSMDLILTLPSLLPAVAHMPVWNIAPTAFSLLAHTWCTNVAAMPFTVYLLGHELKHVYGFFPLNPSMGLASVIVSYNGRITMTLIGDDGIVKDLAALESYLKDAYRDLAGCLPKRAPPPTAVVEVPAVPVPEVMKQNGAAPVAAIAMPAEAAAELARESLPQPMVVIERECPKLFSAEWAQAMFAEINRSEDYRRASTRWTAGSLAFVMEAAPSRGFETPAAVWFDLYRGVCRSARALSPQEAARAAVFVIHGGYPAWMDVLSGRSAPLTMLTNGRLKLTKGALLRLLPHTHSASELVRCAQRVPWS
jgi:putative sterol carrier protein